MNETSASIDQRDYDAALPRLQRQNPIVREQLWGLVGNTVDGRLVLVPSSYKIGYECALLPPNQRPHYALNLAIAGQLSDGRWVFPPSYDDGLRDGLNDLRFAVLAEGERRLFEENRNLRSLVEELNTKLESLSKWRSQT